MTEPIDSTPADASRYDAPTVSQQTTSQQPASQQPQSHQPDATGALAYGLGFLAYIPIPFLITIVTGIVMASVYPGQRRKGPLAAENARIAANWGLTIIVVQVLSLVLSFSLIPVVNGTDQSFIAAMPLLVILPLGITHLIVIIMGLTRAGRGEVFRNRIAIPFLRAKA